VSVSLFLISMGYMAKRSVGWGVDTLACTLDSHKNGGKALQYASLSRALDQHDAGTLYP